MQVFTKVFRESSDKVDEKHHIKIAVLKISRDKKELWGGEFWSDGYYIGTVSGRGDRKIIENYIKNQGREDDIKQLKLFDI